MRSAKIRFWYIWHFESVSTERSKKTVFNLRPLFEKSEAVHTSFKNIKYNFGNIYKSKQTVNVYINSHFLFTFHANFGETPGKEKRISYVNSWFFLFLDTFNAKFRPSDRAL